jgi:hypothetical protein
MSLSNSVLARTRLPQGPWPILVVAALIALSTLCAASLLFAIHALTGAFPPTFLVSGVGDFVAGLTAPLVAWLLLSRPAPGTWLAAVVWLVYSAADFVFVNSANYLANGLASNNSGALVPVGPGYLATLLTIVALSHGAMLAVLLTRHARAYAGLAVSPEEARP